MQGSGGRGKLTFQELTLGKVEKLLFLTQLRNVVAQTLDGLDVEIMIVQGNAVRRLTPRLEKIMASAPIVESSFQSWRYEKEMEKPWLERKLNTRLEIVT